MSFLVNRMLRNSVPYPLIVDAVADRGYTVPERNISDWKTRGGYTEWCLEEDRARERHLAQDNLLHYLRHQDASRLPEAGLQLAATHLSQFLLKPEACQQLASDPQKYSRTVAVLCRLSRQLLALQKYRDEAASTVSDNPHRLQHQSEEEIEKIRDIYSAEKLGARPDEPNLSHRNYFPRPR